MIGGTVFLGRAVVADALARGHAVTIFHRGVHNPDLFPEAEHLLGDRTRDLSALHGREWDAVIDTCGFEPEHVGDAAELLADRAGHYGFVSSGSAYGMSGARAAAAGLAPRPLGETVADTWSWLASGGTLDDWRTEVRASGLSGESERGLLAALRS